MQGYNKTGDLNTYHHIEHGSKSIQKMYIYQPVELQSIHSGSQAHKLVTYNTGKVQMIHITEVKFLYIIYLHFGS
jgi:hypothetical protein